MKEKEETTLKTDKIKEPRNRGVTNFSNGVRLCRASHRELRVRREGVANTRE